MTDDCRVLFVDPFLLVVDKPAGVVVHPAYRNPTGTLLDALPAGARIVTRLDKLTSGAVVVARSAEMHARLQRALAAVGSVKSYLAIVRGVTAECGAIDLPLAADASDRRRRVGAAEGAPSRTLFERVDFSLGSARGGAASLLRCRLVTGRRHQIRVHLASRGWPILGDGTYGEAMDGFPRVALHARRVAFTHPATRERIDVEAPLPDEFDRLLRVMFRRTVTR